LHPRPLGLIFIAAAGVSTLAHRAVYETARHGSPQAAECGLALLTFMLASFGILLLIHGGRIFEHDQGRPARSAKQDRQDLQARLTAPITPAGSIYDTKHGASLMKACHAIMRPNAVVGRRMILELALQDSRRRGPIASRH
jgi:hypothetical protein